MVSITLSPHNTLHSSPRRAFHLDSEASAKRSHQIRMGGVHRRILFTPTGLGTLDLIVVTTNSEDINRFFVKSIYQTISV